MSLARLLIGHCKDSLEDKKMPKRMDKITVLISRLNSNYIFIFTFFTFQSESFRLRDLEKTLLPDTTHFPITTLYTNCNKDYLDAALMDSFSKRLTNKKEPIKISPLPLLPNLDFNEHLGDITTKTTHIVNFFYT